MLMFDGVEKWYGTESRKKWILALTDLKMSLDGNVALLGANGAGKSTILRMIAGCEAISSGKIANSYSVSWPIALQGGIQGGLSGYENAMFIAKIYGVRNKSGYAKAVGDFAELAKDYHEQVNTYSHGMKAKLAFALSIHIEFDAYLIDEVISVGDSQFREKSNEVIHSLLKTKHFIVVSHNMKFIKKYCQKALILSENSLVHYNSIDHAINIHTNNQPAGQHK